MLYGVKCGPLCWGRVGALLTRLPAAVNSPSKARLQFFVGDPALTVGGSAATRAKLLLRAILLWLVLGTKLA